MKHTLAYYKKQLNSMFLRLLLITESPTEQASQFIMPLKSVYSKNICFNEQKCIFEHGREVKTTKEIFVITFFVFVFINSFLLLFQICSLWANFIFALKHFWCWWDHFLKEMKNVETRQRVLKFNVLTFVKMLFVGCQENFVARDKL